MVKSEQEYEAQLGKIKNLPTLPEASLRIMNAVNDPEVSVDEVVDVLFLSPSLVARLMGLANSAYFCYPGKITDLRVAIIRVLGLNLVKSLALGIALNVQLDAKKCQAFDQHFYWVHALTTAVLAQKLAAKSDLDLPRPETIYTSGLLLNIGELVVAFLFPEKMQEILSRCQQSGQSLHDGIRNALGVGHFKLGYILLSHWHVPAPYQTIVKELDNDGYDGELMPLLVLLRLSHGIAAIIARGLPIDMAEYKNELDWLVISVDHASMVVDRVAANRNDIAELAAVISS